MGSWAVVPDIAELRVLEQLLHFDGFIYFDLFKNQLGVQDSTLLSDFVVADYAGYAQLSIPVTPTEGVFGAGGYAGQQAGTNAVALNFPANAGAGQTIYGVFASFLNESGVQCLLYGCNVFDSSSGFTVTPDGFLIATGHAPPTLFGSLTLWDFNQPTGP